MKKVSRENLDALFAAIAEAKKLYLPVADGNDEKRGGHRKQSMLQRQSTLSAVPRTFSSRR